MAARAFLDLDGVLCDFVGASLAWHGFDIPLRDVRWNFVAQLPITPADFWRPLGREFWATLPWTKEGRDILAATLDTFGAENAAILTSPCDTDGCMEGKRDWVRANAPELSERLIIARAKGFFGARGTVLIDDADHNIHAFTRHGGVGVYVPRPWNEHAYRCDADGGCDVAALRSSLEMARTLAVYRREEVEV